MSASRSAGWSFSPRGIGLAWPVNTVGGPSPSLLQRVSDDGGAGGRFRGARGPSRIGTKVAWRDRQDSRRMRNHCAGNRTFAGTREASRRTARKTERRAASPLPGLGSAQYRHVWSIVKNQRTLEPANWGRAVPRTSAELRRDVAILMKQSDDLKLFARELAKVADKLRAQVQDLQAAIGKPRLRRTRR